MIKGDVHEIVKFSPGIMQVRSQLKTEERSRSVDLGRTMAGQDGGPGKTE